MSKKQRIGFFSVAILIFLITSSGCTVRHYTVVKERPDQEISGNQGYLFGVPKEQKEREIKTRKTYVVEVELGQPVSSQAQTQSEDLSENGAEDENIPQKAIIYEENISGNENIGNQGTIYKKEDEAKQEKTYIVKEGDTLEKIASKIYGSKNKWYKIYKTNKTQLKNADKIYPGQVLQLPE